MLDAQNGSQKQAMADKVLHRDLKSEQYESIKLLRKGKSFLFRWWYQSYYC